MRLINIGFGNMLAAERIVAVVSPDSAPVKRLVQGHEDILALRLRITPAPDFVGVNPDDLPYDD